MPALFGRAGGWGGTPLPKIEDVAFYRKDSFGTSYAFVASPSEFVPDGGGFALADTSVTGYRPAWQTLVSGTASIAISSTGKVHIAPLTCGDAQLTVASCASIFLETTTTNSVFSLAATEVTLGMSPMSTGSQIDSVTVLGANKLNCGNWSWIIGGTWTLNLANCNLSASVLDAFFINLAATSPFSQSAIIDATNNATPTNASAAARTALVSVGIVLLLAP